MNAQDYGITIRRVIEEGEACFEARVRELPDVVEYADSHEEVYELAIDTIETTEATLTENRRTMPQTFLVFYQAEREIESLFEHSHTVPKPRASPDKEEK